MTKYPLAWPAGWPRTQAGQRTDGKFYRGVRTEGGYMSKADLSVSDATSRVLDELRRFGVPAGEAVISTNIKLRLDGFPRSDQPRPTDPGVAVYWQRPDDRAPKCMAIDIYTTVEHNLAAIATTLDDMRSIERHGGAQILNRAFEGFIALPAGRKPWRQVFGYPDDAQLTRIEVEGAYRTARSDSHPDHGGTQEEFLAVQRAYEEAARELGFQP